MVVADIGVAFRCSLGSQVPHALLDRLAAGQALHFAEDLIPHRAQIGAMALHVVA